MSLFKDIISLEVIMKVAIDSEALTSGHAVRGVGFYTRELIKELRNLTSLKIDALDFQKSDLSKYDVIHYPYFHPFFVTLPLHRFSADQKIVVTIHDLIPLIYPKNYPPGLKGKFRFLIQKFLVHKVDAVITDSETSKKDIVRFLGIPSEKIYLVYLAAGSLFKKIKDKKRLEKVAKKYHLPSKFAMYLGDVNYNKNIPTLIKACQIAKVPLVICGKQAKEIENEGSGLDIIKGPQDWIRFLAGKPHPEQAHYKLLESLLGESKNVIRLGYVSDEDLVAVFNLAGVYIQPSFYEGFGLPVLQAFSCGTPVIISKTNCLVEIAGGAALVADPKNPKDIADKITEIFKNSSTSPKMNLIKKGFKKASGFSWEKTARATVEVYKKITDRL